MEADQKTSAAPYDPLPIALELLTFVTGLIDAVSYLGLGHIFTANMTGNIVLLGFALAGTPGLSAARSLTSLGAFAAGSILGGRLGASMATTAKRRWLLLASTLEVGFLLAATLSAALLTGHEVGLYAVIVLTALAMGVRNSTIRRLAVPDLTTTVLTLTVTGIAADSSLAGGTNPRVGRRVTSVIAMIAGALIGALLLRHGLAPPLAVAVVCTACISLLYRLVPATKSA